jgi:predicted dehydrogenase
LVFRMNLNQQSHGYMWDVHRNLMKSCSPIVDCGVHYVDVMCQMTDAKPISVYAIGARLTKDVPLNGYNYGRVIPI